MIARTSRARGAAGRAARAERILDAAAALLLRFGYNRVTIDDVAAQAGIGKGTIYLHWNSREALFHAVFQQEYARALDEVLAVLRAEPEAALLHHLLPAFFTAVLRRPLVHAIVLPDPQVLGKLAAGADRLFLAQIIAAVNRYLGLLQARGLARTDLPPEDLSFAVRSTIRGFAVTNALERARGQHPTLERTAELLAITLLRAFEPDVGRPPCCGELHDLASEVVELFTGIAAAFRAYDGQVQERQAQV